MNRYIVYHRKGNNTGSTEVKSKKALSVKALAKHIPAGHVYCGHNKEKVVIKPSIGTNVVSSVCRGTGKIKVTILSKWKPIANTDPIVYTAFATHKGEVTMIDTWDFKNYEYAEGWLDGDSKDPEIRQGKKFAKELGLKFPNN